MQAVELWQANKPVDVITLHQGLRDTAQLEGVGGMSYLAELPDKVPSAANLEYYVEILLKKFTLRRLIIASAETLDEARKDPADVAEVVARASGAVQAVIDISAGGQEAESARVLVPEAMAHIDHLVAHAGQVVGLATGFSDLDVMTWGLEAPEVIVLAARPGMGKTSLAMNIAEHVAVNLKVPVGVFSMEMSKQSLMVRMLCSRARVDSTDVRSGKVANINLSKLTKASLELMRAPLYIDDSSALSILELRARAKRMAQTYGVKLFIVDYLQLMHANVRRSDNRQHEVATISGGMKALAKDLNVPVVLLSQLNRKLDDRGVAAPPKISDLRESGAIEQDADKVILMHKKNKEVTNPNGSYTQNIQVCAIVAKNRNGPTGEVDLVFLRGITRFENAAKASSYEDEDPQPNLPYKEPADDTPF
jgi:replicative DNA helicase